jgi:hypothetical protein
MVYTIGDERSFKTVILFVCYVYFIFTVLIRGEASVTLSLIYLELPRLTLSRHSVEFLGLRTVR